MRGSGLRRSIALVLVLGVVGSLAGASPAGASGSSSLPTGGGSYTGATSSGDVLGFVLSRRPDGSLRLEQWQIEPTLGCDDGTTVTDQGFLYGIYPLPKLDGRHLDLTQDGFSARYRIVGRFLNHRASGWIRFRLATLDAAGNAQVCRTGRLDWTASRGGSRAVARCEGSRIIETQVTGNSAVVTGTRCGSASTQHGPVAGPPSVPSGAIAYGGRLSASGGEFAAIIVARPDRAWRLGFWLVGPTLGCADGSVVTDQGYGYSDYPFPRLDGRHLDHAGAYLAQRTRVVGTFLNHHATGWMTFRTAAFDATGMPQICRTGRVDWVAHR